METVPFLAVRLAESTKFRFSDRVSPVAASDGEHTKARRLKARKEWLRLVLRKRELTRKLKKRIEANNIFICERHLKRESILTGK